MSTIIERRRAAEKVAPRNFAGHCHKSHHATGHATRCTCGHIIECNLVTNDWTLFSDHMKDAHGIKSWQDHQAKRTQWFTPGFGYDPKPHPKVRFSKTPFTPKRFEPGDTVQWVVALTAVGGGGFAVRTGQVWSGHFAPRTRWVVADSTEYDRVFAVHENDLADEWLSVARARVERGRRSNHARDRSDAEYWAGAVAEVESQLRSQEPQPLFSEVA